VDMIIRGHPPHIEAYASLHRSSKKDTHCGRNHWQLSGDKTSLVSFDETWQHIFPPPKIFRGPVGRYQQLDYIYERHRRRSRAIRFLLIEARERHHFEGRSEPFVCINPRCSARFIEPGQWTVHAIATEHDKITTDWVPEDHWVRDEYWVLDEYKAEFHRHEPGLKPMLRWRTEILEELRRDWGKKGSMKRWKAEKAFINQLRHDPAYAHRRPPRQCSTWIEYKCAMNG